jgi:hypothetical protein
MANRLACCLVCLYFYENLSSANRLPTKVQNELKRALLLILKRSKYQNSYSYQPVSNQTSQFLFKGERRLHQLQNLHVVTDISSVSHPFSNWNGGKVSKSTLEIMSMIVAAFAQGWTAIHCWNRWWCTSEVGIRHAFQIMLNFADLTF